MHYYDGSTRPLVRLGRSLPKRRPVYGIEHEDLYDGSCRFDDTTFNQARLERMAGDRSRPPTTGRGELPSHTKCVRHRSLARATEAHPRCPICGSSRASTRS